MKHIAFVLSCSLVLGLASCTGGGGSSPSGAVKAFMDASKAGNKDAAMQCVQAKDREVLQKMEAQQKAGKEIMLPKDFAYKIGGEKITGDTATVTITSNQEGKDETREIRVVKEGGAWKLDLIPDEMLGIMGAAGGPGGIEAMKEMDEEMQKATGDQMKKDLEDAAKEAEGE